MKKTTLTFEQNAYLNCGFVGNGLSCEMSTDDPKPDFLLAQGLQIHPSAVLNQSGLPFAQQDDFIVDANAENQSFGVMLKKGTECSKGGLDDPEFIYCIKK